MITTEETWYRLSNGDIVSQSNIDTIKEYFDVMLPPYDHIEKVEGKPKRFKVGLCQGRHEIEGVKAYIFPQNVNPLDTDWLESSANLVVHHLVKSARGPIELDLYVTGLTVALVGVINACRLHPEVTLTLYHYDRESGSYYPQKVY